VSDVWRRVVGVAWARPEGSQRICGVEAGQCVSYCGPCRFDAAFHPSLHLLLKFCLIFANFVIALDHRSVWHGALQLIVIVLQFPADQFPDIIMTRPLERV
jgi:hypothetical protein